MVGKKQNTDLGALHLRINSAPCARLIAEEIERVKRECRWLEESHELGKDSKLMICRATIMALHLLQQSGDHGLYATELQLTMVKRWRGRPMDRHVQREVIYRVVSALAEAKRVAMTRTFSANTKAGQPVHSPGHVPGLKNVQSLFSIVRS